MFVTETKQTPTRLLVQQVDLTNGETEYFDYSKMIDNGDKSSGDYYAIIPPNTTYTAIWINLKTRLTNDIQVFRLHLCDVNPKTGKLDCDQPEPAWVYAAIFVPLSMVILGICLYMLYEHFYIKQSDDNAYHLMDDQGNMTESYNQMLESVIETAK